MIWEGIVYVMVYLQYIIRQRMNDRQQHVESSVQINKFQWINSDYSLSQFKYHLIVRRVYIQQGQFNQFAKNIHKNFKLPLAPDAIHIVQILQSHQHLTYDLIIGFRKDIDAKTVYQKAPKFVIYGAQINIELAEAFKIYMNQRQLPLKKVTSDSKNKRSSRSDSSSSSDNDRRYVKRQKYRRNQSNSRSSRSKSRSRSSSRSKYSRSKSRVSVSNDRNSVIGRFYMMLTPVEWDKEYIEQQMLSTLKCKVDDIQIIEKRQDSLTFYIAAIYCKEVYSFINTALFNFKLADNYLLLIREEEIIENGLKQQLKKYQFKAFKYSNHYYNEKTFEELINLINNTKDCHINILHIFQQENYYIVTTSTKITALLKFIRLVGWKLEQAYLHTKFVVSLKDRWNQMYKKRGDKY